MPAQKTGGAHPLSGGTTGSAFTLAIITAPAFFPGEAAYLEALLAAGLEKLHLRKPGADKAALENLLQKIDIRWHSQLVLHPWAGTAGRPDERMELAARYGIGQLHCSFKELGEPEAAKMRPVVAETGNPDSRKMEPIALSSSLHSWEEVREIRAGELSYVFLSPVFDSNSKPGYAASPALRHRPPRPYPCKVLGLGGIDKDRVGELVREGWDGAAVLGWIWAEPGAAVERYEQLKEIITELGL